LRSLWENAALIAVDRFCSICLHENAEPFCAADEKSIAFSLAALYNHQAVCIMMAESRAISMREPCQDRKVAAVSAFWDVLRGRSA